MKALYWILAGTGFIALGLAGYWVSRSAAPKVPEIAGTSVPAASQVASASATAPAEISLRELVDDLGNPDRATSVAARARLAHLPYERRGELRVLAGGMLPPQVQDLLNRRLAEIDADIALHPPLISLHVQNGNLKEVAARLAEATGAQVASDTQLYGDGLFTLDAQEKPFWKIVTALSRQVPLTAIGNNDEFAFMTTSPGGTLMQSSIQGPFIFYAFKPMIGDELRCVLAADPRTPMEGQKLQFTVIDDKGNAFVPPEPARSGPAIPYILPCVDRNCYRVTFPFKAFRDAHPGATIDRVKVHAQIVVATKVATLEIKDFQKHTDVPYAVGSSTLTFSSPGRNSTIPGMFRIQRGNVPTYAAMRILDGNGAIVRGHGCLGGTGTNHGSTATGPFTLQIRAAEETTTLAVDFELKQ